MGTDWGFGCETCGTDADGRINEVCVISNFRDTDMLEKWLAAPPSYLESILSFLDEGMFRSDCYYALRFAVEHRKRGHVVRVADEYHRWPNTCFDRLPCSECGHSRHCVLPYKHEGPHQPKPKESP